MIHNFKDWMRVIQWVDPDAHTAADLAALDTPIDTLGWRFAIVIVNVGDSAGTWTIQVEASDAAAGSYLDVTGAVFTITTGTDDVAFIGVLDTQGGAENMNRFLQLNGVTAVGAVDLGISVVLLNPTDSREQINYSSGGADELVFEL